MKNLYQKILVKITGFLKEGISPEKIALALAFGISLGLIPLLGSTSILCAVAAFSFRLNMPSIQLVNYIAYPVQLILYIPFLRTGTLLFSSEQFDYDINTITQMLSENLFKTISDLFWINAYGLLLWALLAPFIFSLVYFISLPMLRKAESGLRKK